MDLLLVEQQVFRAACHTDAQGGGYITGLSLECSLSLEFNGSVVG